MKPTSYTHPFKRESLNNFCLSKHGQWAGITAAAAVAVVIVVKTKENKNPKERGQFG